MRNLLFYSLCLVALMSFSQENKNWTFDINYFKGNITLHNDDILHLIQGHPDGFILALNKTTFGEEVWEQRFNYPDYGISFSYQNLKNGVLGNNYAFYGHYNFYFLNRHLMFRIGQGLAFTSNPYDKVENHKNIAFGSKFMSSTYVMINYKKERIIDRFGIQVGLSFIHYSNANVKAPNNSINSATLSFGVNYNFNEDETDYIFDLNDEKFTEPVKYNVVFRSGVNQSDIIGSGQFPFYVVSAYADKRLSRKSAVQLGTDAMFSNFLKELIYYESVAFPEFNTDSNTDFKRVGIFVGHELFINKLSLVTQFGYYIYYPFDFINRVYQRVGVKRYFGDQWFAAVSLKTHFAKAEALEFGIGIRF